MLEEILKAMHIISEEKVKEAPYNYCIKAQITKAYSKGKYRVKTSEQSEFNVNSLNLNFKYRVGDIVWVLVINNTFTKYRYVLGSAEEAKLSRTILVSPKGNEFEVSVDDDGNLTTTKIKEEE